MNLKIGPLNWLRRSKFYGILSNITSLGWEKVLKIGSLKWLSWAQSILLYFILLLHHGWRKYKKMAYWNAPDGLNLIAFYLIYFTMVEQIFWNGPTEMPHNDPMLLYFTLLRVFWNAPHGPNFTALT